jgi:putative cell wall-binding protein
MSATAPRRSTTSKQGTPPRPALLPRPSVRAAIALALACFAALLAFPAITLASPGDIYAEGTYYRVTTYPGHGSLIGVPVDLNVCSPSGSWVDDHRWPLYAPGDGNVAVHSHDGGGSGWGNSIIWTSADGSERLFMAHLDSFGKTGQVSAADSIGYVGTTGYSTGDHVHFERSVNGAYSAPELSGVALSAGSIYRSAGPYGATRLAGRDRYATAVRIAREGWGGRGSDWAGVTHVVIASGDDRAAADPLAAAGLCGVYDAPLLLVSAEFTPNDVKSVVAEMVADNPGTAIEVHLVGGPVSVPDARYDDIANAVGADRLAKDRLLSTGDRYDLAAQIALEMERVGGATPETVLIANGADDTKFFDALALSPIAAAKGYPILLVSETSVPRASNVVLEEFEPATVIVGGGPATVSEQVRTTLGASRWSGGDRYATATSIATNAMNSGMLTAAYPGVAAKLPDALAGGAMVGRVGSPLVITDGEALTSVTGSWLTGNTGAIQECYVLGGEKSLTPAAKSQIEARLR